MPICLLNHPRAEVWCGDSLDLRTASEIMAGRLADALITDAPYSARTHDGHRAGKITADRAAGFASNSTPESRYAAKVASGAKERADLEYESWDGVHVARFLQAWEDHVRGWWVSITDHVLSSAWEQCFRDLLGLYPFYPLPLVETGSRIRMLGDGPSNWTCWVMTARPRTAPWSKWGTLRGSYIQAGERRINSAHGSDRITGGKPMASMLQIVEDYSRKESPLFLGPGTETSLIVDPCAGGGTTLLAALRTGRRCIGVERDLGRAELCAERVQAELDCSERWATKLGQSTLFGGAA